MRQLDFESEPDIPVWEWPKYMVDKWPAISGIKFQAVAAEWCDRLGAPHDIIGVNVLLLPPVHRRTFTVTLQGQLSWRDRDANRDRRATRVQQDRNKPPVQDPQVLSFCLTANKDDWGLPLCEQIKNVHDLNVEQLTVEFVHIGDLERMREIADIIAGFAD